MPVAATLEAGVSSLVDTAMPGVSEMRSLQNEGASRSIGETTNSKAYLKTIYTIQELKTNSSVDTAFTVMPVCGKTKSSSRLALEQLLLRLEALIRQG